MKRFYASKLLILFCLSAGITFSAKAQTLVYNQSFTGGSIPSTQCTAWTSYCSSLLSSYIYTGFTISGSNNPTGFTCTNATVATAVANALRTASANTQTSDGHTWYVGTGCGSGCGGGGAPVVELAVDQGTCACGTVASLRPAINNTNWGGISGATCGAASQTLIVTFFYQSITYTGGSPRTIPNACQNSGPISLNSLLTTSDPATGLTATWSVNAAPAHGTLSGFPITATTGPSVTPPGSLTYTPTAGFSGVDSFNIKASDGSANAFCTIIVTVNPSPSGITGIQCVVPGGVTQQLSDITPGGSWTSANPAIATVSSSGVLTGISAGTTTISYAPPASICPAVATVTVSTLPAAIGGTTNVCIGNTTALIEAGTGVWSSSVPSIGSISTTGVVTGISGGTTNITYALPSTCMAVAPVLVNVAPTAITGTLTTCASGGTTTLTDGITGGTWTSGSTSIATVGAGSGLVTGVITGVAAITYTAPTGCITFSNVTVNPLPAPIGGTTSVCAGSTTTLIDATAGGTWSSSNTSQATIGAGTGIVTGITAGSPTITYSLAGTGCKITAPFIVNPLPGSITGGTTVCAGNTLTLSDAGGGTWSSSNLLAATINTFSGVLTGVGPGTTSITYSLATGCSVASTISVNPLPTAYTVTGGGSLCAGGAGVHIGLSFASTGVNYVLLRGGSPVSLSIPGSNSGLDFGLYTVAGIYTVLATNATTGCTNNMTGSVTVTVNPLPALHNITGGGSYCIGGAGVSLGADGSDLGINYQLFNGGSPVGPVFAGTGALLSFGSFTTAGTYTLVATNAVTSCSQTIGSSAVISVSAAPAAYPVTGGGSYCAGGTGEPVNLTNSDAGTVYQVFHGGSPVGSPVSSIGGPINFGLFTAAGTYTITGTNLSGCAGNMSGSVTIIINPLPAVNTVTGGGPYCAGGSGVHIGLSFSTPGISYSLLFGSGTVTTVPGSGSGLDFGAQTVSGIYTVQATNATTGCIANMFGSAVITVNPLPDGSFSILGGGPYCAGTSGSDINISGSEGSVNYQLYNGTTLTGAPHGGTGSGIDFGYFTTSGIYTVKATNAVTGCSIFLSGSVAISTNPLPTLHSITGGGSYCAGGAGADIMLNGSNIGISYYLKLSGTIVNTMSGTGSPLDFGPQTAPGSYTVTATNTTTGCTQNMLGSVTVNINPLPAIDTVTGGGTYCAGGTGYPVGLNGSSTGISYQLYNTGTISGSPVTGSGSAISFGLKTAAGNYTVKAINTLTGCISTMGGSAIINVNPLPNIDTLSGGGNYCTSDSGKVIILNNSDLSVNYQLYRGGIAVGTPLAGITGPLSFGLETVGIYTAKATDATTGCTSNMIGSVHVNTIAPTAYTVTGGGSYCVGGTGVLVNLSGSTPGLSYQLVTSGSSPVGTPLAGTGLPLSYGLITGAGTYSVIATDTLLGCVGNMAGNVSVVINSLPVTENVTGGGSFCAGGGGAHIGLSSSVSGINYQLLIGGVPTGTLVSGSTGSSLDFGLQTTAGTYTAIAVNATTGCANNMTGSAVISILPTPAPYTITIDNSGNYCAGDSGLHIGLINSQTGIHYQLYRGSTIMGTPVTGSSGSAITLGLETIAGTYTVVAVNPSSMCTSNMTGSVTINIVPLPAVHTVTGGGSFCPGGAGVNVGLDGSTVGTSYELYNGTSPVASTFGTGTSVSFGLQNIPGTYTVIATSAITPCVNTMFGSADVNYDIIPQPIVVLHSYPGNGVGVTQVDSIKATVSNGGPNPTFQWYVNGTAIAGATNSVFTGQSYFQGDSVSCAVTASGPCGGLTTTKHIIISLLGVGVKQVTGNGADVRLLPNPNNGTFSLKGTTGNSTNEELNVEITNMLGQVVYTGKIQALNGNIDQKINLGNVTNGMYLLNLGSGTQRTIFHFVIEQ